MKFYYNIAGFDINLDLPWTIGDISELLPSFSGFETEKADSYVLELTVYDYSLKPEYDDEVLLEERTNDNGYTRLSVAGDKYIVDIKYDDDGIWHRMVADAHFANVSAFVETGDVYMSMVLSSMIRIAFSQCILRYEAVSVHSSVVKYDNRGFLFLGTSGTGKSTHSRLWMKNMDGCTLLNDDNPILRVAEDNSVRVFGSPWSGKEDCYKNESCEVAGIVGLSQAPYNKASALNGIEAFILLMKNCSVVRHNSILNDCFCNTLSLVAENVKVIGLQCLPDDEAVRVCHENLI